MSWRNFYLTIEDSVPAKLVRLFMRARSYTGKTFETDVWKITFDQVEYRPRGGESLLKVTLVNKINHAEMKIEVKFNYRTGEYSSNQEDLGMWLSQINEILDSLRL